jgi:hypothetical protein
VVPLSQIASTYAILRAIAAVFFGIALWRERQRAAVSIAQALADLSAVLFLVALTSPDLRTSIGLWWVALFVYTATWETVHFRWRVQDVLHPAAGDASALTFEGAVVGWGCLGLIAWEVLGVALPLAAGFGLAFDAVAPNNLTFPKG